MKSDSAISWRLGPRTLPKKTPVQNNVPHSTYARGSRTTDLRGSDCRSAKTACAIHSRSPTDPSSVRVTVGNDGSAPARYSDEVFVHARMLSGHHRRGLTPADDDGSHSRIQ